jgi:arsenate reductase (glutaredoxin)
MSITVYGIPNCDTVKRARAWLAEHPLAVEFHDFKKGGVPEADLSQWMKLLGKDALVNRKGTTWRKLSPAEQAMAEHDKTAMALMQAQPSVIKRPVVRWPDGRVTVGFDAEQWAQRLAEASR